tara:strand:+ start:2704 stop:3519 length:816 start_codon:yes stop_codon:yes gene_type:complete
VLYKLGVIGFGNIAKAIINPLLENNFLQPEEIICVVNSRKSFENIKSTYKFNVNIFESSAEESQLVWDCPFKLLSIKPQQLKYIKEVGKKINSKNVIISILAGVNLKTLENKFPNHNCIRCVTNIPITINKGLTGISWGKEISESQQIFTRNLFKNSSIIYELSEEYLDIFLALTSSAPAIIALIIDSMSDGGLTGGLSKELSEKLVLEMISGTISLIKESDISPLELRNMVTSPGGTTISALRVLEGRSFRSALIESIMAARDKSKEFSL